MPDLHLITNLFDQQRYEIIKEKLNNENKMLVIRRLMFDHDNIIVVIYI
jgi:hypothetical protein